MMSVVLFNKKSAKLKRKSKFESKKSFQITGNSFLTELAQAVIDWRDDWTLSSVKFIIWSATERNVIKRRDKVKFLQRET